MAGIGGISTGAGRGTVCPGKGVTVSIGAGTYLVTSFGTYTVFVTGLYLTTF